MPQSSTLGSVIPSWVWQPIINTLPLLEVITALTPATLRLQNGTCVSAAVRCGVIGPIVAAARDFIARIIVMADVEGDRPPARHSYAVRVLSKMEDTVTAIAHR